MKIEEGVVIPAPKTGQGRPVGTVGKLVRQLQIGQSILFDTEREATNARRIAKEIRIKVCQRKMSGGWRVWRVEG